MQERKKSIGWRERSYSGNEGAPEEYIRTSVWVHKFFYLWAKNFGINISQFLTNKLREAYETYSPEEEKKE